MTDTGTEAILEQVPCIRYPVRFRQKNDKDENKDVRALIDSGSKVNTMHPAYAMKLGPHTRKIDVGAQKIDRSYPNTFEMVIADYSVKNKPGRVRFF